MAKNSAVNLDITVNADGFDISGGTTVRKFSVTGSDVTLTGSGSNTHTFPSASDTLLGRLDVDTTPVQNADVAPISSGWAYTHVNDASAHHTKYALTDDLTSSEITQLQNINLVTITNAQWGYLGAMTGNPTSLPADAAGALLNDGAGNLSWSAVGSGDMLLSSIQSVTGLKTFDASKLAMKGSSTGITTIATANDSATNYTATLQKASGTLAYLTDVVGITQEMHSIACSDETTALSTGTDKAKFIIPYACTINNIYASVSTAPVGSTLIVDVNKNGTTVFSTELTIDASETNSLTAATPPVISVSSVAAGDTISIDIVQVGSSTAGAGLKVYLKVTPT